MQTGMFAMTLAAKLEDFEVTLEHLLMDVFVSKGYCLLRDGRPFSATNEVLAVLFPLLNLILFHSLPILTGSLFLIEVPWGRKL